MSGSSSIFDPRAQCANPNHYKLWCHHMELGELSEPPSSSYSRMQRRKGRRKGEIDVIKDCLLDFHKRWLVSSLVLSYHHWLLGEANYVECFVQSVDRAKMTNWFLVGEIEVGRNDWKPCSKAFPSSSFELAVWKNRGRRPGVSYHVVCYSTDES